MARRTHATAVGWVACDELSELGAGSKEGWLTDSALLASLHSHHLALAHGTLAFVLGWEEYRAQSSSATRPTKIRPSLSPEEGEITAIEWIAIDDLVALALGTSGGYLLIYSKEADLIHKQFVHPCHVLRLRIREIEDKAPGNGFSYELCVVMPGVIARFDGADVKSLLQRWFNDTWEGNFQKREEGEGGAFGRIPYQVWNVSKNGTCADAAITGLMPPPLLELPTRERYYCAVTVGSDAVISAYRLSEDRSRSLVGTVLSKVVPAAFSTISSFSKMIWRSEQVQQKKPEMKQQSFAKASPITCLKDHPRKGEKLTLSPSGSLAAITDSLGRILLLDTQALVVVRLWKGYRDACCLFMEMFVGGDKATSSSAHYEQTKYDYCLCLAIHAPRKGIIELASLTVQLLKAYAILAPPSSFFATASEHVIAICRLCSIPIGKLLILRKLPSPICCPPYSFTSPHEQ